MARTGLLPNSNNEEGDNKDKHKECCQIATTNVVGTQRHLRLPFRSVAIEHADDAVNSALDAAGEIVRLEARYNNAGYDDRRQRVGHGAFKPVTDLNADLVFGRRYQEQDAVVFLGLASFQ